MSLLMEALKRAEAAKFATVPPMEKPTIAEILPPLPISAPEETMDEVSAWQRQLLSETSEQAHFIIEDSELDQLDETEYLASPLEELLNTETTSAVDWENEILPEFQQVLATEENLQPIVLEDNHSNLPADEEPEIISETETIVVTPPTLILNFSREIAPDLSLHDLNQEPASDLKLEWENELTPNQPSHSPEPSVAIPNILSVQEAVTPRPDSARPIVVDEPTLQAQRDEIKRLFKASLQRKATSRWVHGVATLLIIMGVSGGYVLYHEKLLDSYIMIINQQFGQNLLPISRPIPVVAVPSPVEPIKSPVPEVKPPAPQPTLAQIAPALEPPPAPKHLPEIKPAPPPPVQPEVTKSAPIPRERPIEPKIELKPVVELKQTVENKEIQISRSGQKSQTHPRLLQAYSALQHGDDKTALSLYRSVLQQESQNRDALLGLAAIAVQQQQFSQATHYYQEVLKYYPQDTVAKTNLLSISEKNVGAERESQLKTLASTAQKPAYIHFQLGLVYAQQERWNEAQQAFFEAYRIESQQADYAYNLAVSLEHLHQSQAAITYYQRAVQLQRKHGKGFNFQPDVVQQRITTLQAMTGGRGITNALSESE